MDKEVITFGDIGISKHKFCHRENLNLLDFLSSMVSSGKKNDKYFISYKDNDHKTKPLGIMLAKMSHSS